MKSLTFLLSIIGVLIGFFFDLSLIKVSSREVLDINIYILSIIIIVDVVSRESLRLAFLPYLTKLGISKPSCKSFINLALVLCLFMALNSLWFIDVNNCLLLLSLYISSFLVSVIQCYLIANEKVVISNIKNIVFYIFPFLLLFSDVDLSKSTLITSFIMSNIMFVLMTKNMIQRVDDANEISLSKLAVFFVSGCTNLVIGQGLRFAERTILLSMQSGILTSYYLAFRIFASIQQIIATNVSNIYIKKIVNHDFTFLNKIKKLYVIATGLSVFILIVLLYNFIEEFSHISILDNVNVKQVFIVLVMLFLALFPQMMMPITLTMLYCNNKKKAWLKSYALINFITVLVLAIVSLLDSALVFTLVITCNVYINYFFSKKY